MFLKLFKNIFCLSQAKKVCQARVCAVAKPTNIVLDKQNFKCLPNNVCPFGRGFKLSKFYNPNVGDFWVVSFPISCHGQPYNGKLMESVQAG